MPSSSALHSSASLKAANAKPYAIMKDKLDPMLLLALQDMGFQYMTPVQSKVLDRLPSLRSDCLVQAKTGTGKTTAFLLPAIQNTIMEAPQKGQVSVLIMSPTRELALQIAAEASRLVARLPAPLQVHTAFGGTAKASNLNRFLQGDPKILVATPGRLNDYLEDPQVRSKFSGLKTLILDEADRMLDQGFLPDIRKALRALPPKISPKGQWQGMCFSATIPPKMQEVLSHVLKDHVSISTVDASEPPTLAKVPQYSVVIPKAEDTFIALSDLINAEISVHPEDPKIILFGTTANLVALYAELYETQTHLKVHELHSRMSQPARTKATEAFKKATSGIIFATDVIGRGMDFPDVSLVLQVGLPADADAYTHRVGRTARAGKDGRAIILLTESESFFLKVNRQFPILQYPTMEKILNTEGSANQITSALQQVDPKSKQKAYSAYLGFMKGFMNKMQMKPADLVKSANDFALNGMHTGDVPEMEKKTIGKMGLKGTPGIRYAATINDTASRKRRAPPPESQQEVAGSSRRLKHQNIPESIGSLNGISVAQNQYRGDRQTKPGKQPTREQLSGLRGEFDIYGDKTKKDKGRVKRRDAESCKFDQKKSSVVEYDIVEASMLRLSVCTAQPYRVHLGCCCIHGVRNVKQLSSQPVRALATTAPWSKKKSRDESSNQSASNNSSEQPKIRWYQQLVPWSAKRTKSDPSLGLAAGEQYDDAKWLKDQIEADDAEIREMEGDGGKTMVEPLLAKLPEEDAQKIREAILKEDREEERKEREAALLKRRWAEKYLPKKEELEIKWQLPPAQESYLQRLNRDVWNASAELTDQSLRKKLWQSYVRCKTFLPPFLHLIPLKTWDVLWASQQTTDPDDRKWGAHLIKLTEDMQEAGVDLNIYQRILLVEALRIDNQQEGAIAEWRELGDYIKDDERASAEYELLGVRLFASQGDPSKAEKIAMNYLGHGKEGESRILIPILRAWAHRGDDAGARHAWALYLRYRTLVGSSITMDDYDLISKAFLDIGRTDVALAVFKDMMLTGGKKDYNSLELYRKSLGILGKTQASAITAEEINRVSLTGLTVLPRRFQNKFFYGSWLKKLIGMGEINAAAQVIALQFERGVKPDPKHLNGIIGAWLRRGNNRDRERAEQMAWAMIYERLDFVKQRRASPDMQSASPVPESEFRVPVHLRRTVAPANIETFSLLLLHYARRPQQKDVDIVNTTLELAQIKPNVYYINHLLYNDLRRGQHQAVWIKYKEMFRTVKPDLETFACLWDCEKAHLASLILHRRDKFPNPRQIMSEMMAWFTNLKTRSAERQETREEFSQELYDQIIRCFGLASDAEGLVVALYTLREKFGYYPEESTMRLVKILISRMDVGQEAQIVKPGRHKLGRKQRRTKADYISQIMEIIIARREKEVKDAGVVYVTQLQDRFQREERLFILAQFVQTVLKRITWEERMMEGNIDKAAWQMGVGGIPIEDHLPSYDSKESVS